MLPTGPSNKLQYEILRQSWRVFYSTVSTTSKHPVQATICWVSPMILRFWNTSDIIQVANASPKLARIFAGGLQSAERRLRSVLGDYYIQKIVSCHGLIFRFFLTILL